MCPSDLVINDVSALEVLDSRGRPTVAVTVQLSDGTVARAGVPSGASTGSGEAVELRDGDERRFSGLGVLRAVENVNGAIAELVQGKTFRDVRELDGAMIAADGTSNRSNFGANAVVGVSMAAARAHAAASGVSLWEYLRVPDWQPRLPVPHFNVVNGGAHAANELDFQEFMLAPLGADSLRDAVRAGAEIYATLRALLKRGGHATGLGDEGGFAPELSRPEEVLTVLVEAIDAAGYRPGRDGVAIALDPAATGFHADGRYQIAGESHTSDDLVARYTQLVSDFPIWSIEDGMAEDDDEGWRSLTTALTERVQLVGDDNFVTDPERIDAAARSGIANAALIKLNQIGTVSQTLDALAMCQRHGFGAMVSHRSGETEDDFIADLAVGSGCGQLKSGAPARGERVAKYNRLLAIASTQPDLPFGIPSA